MSTSATRVVIPPPGTPRPTLSRRLVEQLDHVARRSRRTRLFVALAGVWLVAALLAGAILLASWNLGAAPSWTAPAVALAALVAAIAVAWSTLRGKTDELQIARRIEQRYPELDAKLLSAIAQQEPASGGRLGYLQTTVLGEAVAHGRRDGWKRAAPWASAVAAYSVQCLTLALFGAALIAVFLQSRRTQQPLLAAGIAKLPGIQFQATIEPGTVELERGTSLLVLARFEGPLPPDVTLDYAPTGEPSQQLSMSKSLDDPVFAGRTPSVETDLTYQVHYGQQRSETYRVTVFDYPDLERADIKLAPPSYTGQSETLVEDTRKVTVVEGTRLTLIARLNKEVAHAKLLDDAGSTVELKADPAQQRTYVASLPMTKTARAKLELIDAQGRKNREPAEFTFTVVPNRRPEIKLVFPSRDVQVSPLEEIDLQASVWDDFGIASYGIAYSLDGATAKERVLGENVPGKERRDAKERVSFEEFKAEPDQLLSYFFFADDTGPDGERRRTSSDMFFCEVRPFDEIFRQGEPPPSGQSQPSSSDTDKLAELQKQVISATWKLLRRETEKQPTADFAKDAAVLVEGQQEAIALADELAEKLKTPESRRYLEAARKKMQAAVEQLQMALIEPSVAPLTPALAAEQAAYQALLKLRAREHQVTKGSKSQGSGGNRSSQQLSQLELKNSENRYEQQRTAEKQQEEAKRENREVLNRLRELAQRQEDLNQRINELQSALQAATSEEQKAEIRRQLKRLRDEEQEILRDADELRNRMDQAPNQQQVADAKRQLDETRANVRQASEALKAGEASQAAAAGSRAEQQLEKLRDDFRKNAAGQFSDEMRQMREEARQLDERQRELGQKLANLDQPKSKSLREPSGREQVGEGFEQQQQALQRLLDQMRQTVEEAETPEPLLSKQLYDTLRKARQQQPDLSLGAARELLQRGFVAESQRAEQDAQAGIGRLKEGIEKAAENVLGDETEAIRRARDDVAELAKAIDEERKRATGQGSDDESKQDDEQASGKAAAKNKANPGKQDSQPGEAQPGESQQASAQPANTPQGKGSGKSPQSKPGKQAQPGEQPGSGEQPKPGEQAGQTPGPGGSKPGQAPGEGQQAEGGKPSADGKPGDSTDAAQSATSGGSPKGRGAQSLIESLGMSGGPLTGNDFRPWADRLRDVEDMIDDPQLRAEAATIRDRASAMRAEFKRHSKTPNWELVRETVYEPLNELRQRLSEELLKRQSKDALVPLDRDPVPPKYSEQVRRYYQRLGSGQ
jgi:hypothetical protein